MRKAAACLTVMLMLFGAMGAGALAAPSDDEITDNITVEYHYMEGEEPDIPETIEEFFRDYELVSLSEPMLEAMLPITRTYVFRVDGAMAETDLELLKETAGLELSPVEMVLERNVDKVETVSGLPNNDVEALPQSKVFTVSSAGSPGGTAAVELQRAGVSFDITGYDEYGLPSSYAATIVYRGVETYIGVAYYVANMSYTRDEVIAEVPQYVVVAVYEPVGGPPMLGVTNDDAIRGLGLPNNDLPTGPVAAASEAEEPEEPDEPEEEAARDGFLTRSVDETRATLSPDERALANREVLEELRGQGIPIIRIGDTEVPLFGSGNPFVWSLVNLVMGIIGLALALIIGIRFAVQKVREQREAGTIYINPRESQRKRRRSAWLVTAAVMGVAGFAVFLLTEKMFFLMVMLDRWTIVNTAILAVEIVGYLLAFRHVGDDGYADIDGEVLI